MFFFFLYDEGGSPSPGEIRSLAEVPGLERLLDVCGKFNVEITAFGSVVRRIARHVLTSHSKSLPDIFALAPFLSDIDLRHSGTAEKTQAIREAILCSIPWSECLRWEIRSEKELAPYRADEERLPVIPANKLSLSTRGGNGIQDPFNAAEEIRTGRFQLHLNPFYSRSVLRRQNRDCELIHALFFLQLVCEHAEGDLRQQPGWQHCTALITASRRQETTVALGESAYLRARVQYRLKALIVSMTSEPQWMQISDTSELLPLLRDRRIFPQLWAEPWMPPSPVSFWERPLFCGCRLGGNLFRVMEHFYVDEDEANADAYWGSMRATYVPLDLCEHPLPMLSETQKVVAISPQIDIREGRSPSGGGHEHVHVQFPLLGSANRYSDLKVEDLGVLVLLAAEKGEGAIDADGPVWISRLKENQGRAHGLVVSLPSDCRLQTFTPLEGETRMLIQTRVNFGDLLNVFPSLVDRVTRDALKAFHIRIIIVADRKS